MSTFRPPPSPAYWMWDLNPIHRRDGSARARKIPCRGLASDSGAVDVPPRPRGGYRAIRLGRWEFPGSDDRALELAEDALPRFEQRGR